jgi:GntR family transcriptional regulator
MLRTREPTKRQVAADDSGRAALRTGDPAGDEQGFRPQAAIALHHQIKEDVLLHLRSGRWPPGFELPSEESLCRHYGVSRGTLRRAISDLVSDGYIERHRGRGTFVSKPKLESGVIGSYSRFRVIGPPLDAGGRVLSCRRMRAVKDVAAMLQIDAGEAIWRLERLRYTEGRPVTLQTSFIPVRLCADLGRHDLRTRHLVDVMRDEYGVQLTRAIEYVDPTAADEYAARHLGVPLRTPLFQIERTTYSTGDVIAEYRQALLRGDAYRYRIELR